MRARVLHDAVEGVTKRWAKQRKQEERHAAARANRQQAMQRAYRRVTVREAVWHLLPGGYAKASGDGKYSTSARQLYYAIRATVQEYTDRELGYGYFSQVLLPEFLDEFEGNPDCDTADWDVTYDARGELKEPFTGRSVPLGTIAVRQYLERVGMRSTPSRVPDFSLPTRFPTFGPEHRFSGVMFVEKQGFDPLLEQAAFAPRYDLAIMSTKGMSTVAARRLVDSLCSKDVPLLLLHDFDVSGMSIAGTLQGDTRRYQFKQNIRVIDLGLRLDDITGLEREPVFFRADADKDRMAETLRRHGATQAEIRFLLVSELRVELNAMTSPQFVEFLDRKLTENGIGKVVPDTATLRLAAQRAAAIAAMQKAIRKISAAEAKADIPPNIRSLVLKALAYDPTRSWDDVLVQIMGGVPT